MIGIYKIQNKINNKIYIGQSVNIQQRWLAHKTSAKNSKSRTRLVRAFEKYGIDNFDFSVIEECEVEQLDYKEQKWIDYHHSIETGYNMVPAVGGFFGEDNPNANIDKEAVIKIRERVYADNEMPKEVWQDYKHLITYKHFHRVCTGQCWSHLDTDMVRPIPTKSFTGENNPKARLAADDVLNIRNRYYIDEENMNTIFCDYEKKVSYSAFTKALRGDTWKSVDLSMKYAKKAERKGKSKAKLTEKDVLKIRYEYEILNKNVYEIHKSYYDVSENTIRRVINYQTWKNVKPVSTISEA